MKKIEMIIRPEKMEAVKEAADRLGVGGITVTSVLGCGAQKGKTEIYRGSEMMINLLHKVKIEVVIADDMVKDVVAGVREAIKTGQVGDGKIFIMPIEDAVRIRTGESGRKAL